MANVRCVAIAMYVGGPFEFGGVGMASTDISRLKLFELLLSA